jgi:hypothetical protein
MTAECEARVLMVTCKDMLQQCIEADTPPDPRIAYKRCDCNLVYSFVCSLHLYRCFCSRLTTASAILLKGSSCRGIILLSLSNTMALATSFVYALCLGGTALARHLAQDGTYIRAKRLSYPSTLTATWSHTSPLRCMEIIPKIKANCHDNV